MAKPRASSGRVGLMGNQGTDMFSILSEALATMFAPGQEDGLRKFAVNNRSDSRPGGMPNPMNLSGVDLMNYWSSLDANTPDKITTVGRMDDIYSQYSGSPYAKWLESLGVAPHQGSVGKRADRFNEARGYPTGKIF